MQNAECRMQKTVKGLRSAYHANPSPRAGKRGNEKAGSRAVDVACFLHSAFCLLPSAFCLLPSALLPGPSLTATLHDLLCNPFNLRGHGVVAVIEDEEAGAGIERS